MIIREKHILWRNLEIIPRGEVTFGAGSQRLFLGMV
jgi:hypothetical protein